MTKVLLYSVEICDVWYKYIQRNITLKGGGGTKLWGACFGGVLEEAKFMENSAIVAWIWMEAERITL